MKKNFVIVVLFALCVWLGYGYVLADKSAYQFSDELTQLKNSGRCQLEGWK